VDIELTRRAFLQTLAAVSLPLFVPIDLLNEVIILEGPIIDDEVFNAALGIDFIKDGKVYAFIDMAKALSAVSFVDQHGGSWSLEVDGNAQDCGGMEIKALVSEGRRIEV